MEQIGIKGRVSNLQTAIKRTDTGELEATFKFSTPDVDPAQLQRLFQAQKAGMRKIGFNNDDGVLYFTRECQKESLYGNPEENGFASGTIEVEPELAEQYFEASHKADALYQILIDAVKAKNRTIPGWIE